MKRSAGEAARDRAADAAEVPVVTEEDAAHDARTVVLTPMAAHQAPLHATLLERAGDGPRAARGGASPAARAHRPPGPAASSACSAGTPRPTRCCACRSTPRTAPRCSLPGPEVDDDEPERRGGVQLGHAAACTSTAARPARGAGTAACATLVQELLGDGADAAAFARRGRPAPTRPPSRPRWRCRRGGAGGVRRRARAARGGDRGARGPRGSRRTCRAPSCTSRRGWTRRPPPPRRSPSSPRAGPGRREPVVQRRAGARGGGRAGRARPRRRRCPPSCAAGRR